MFVNVECVRRLRIDTFAMDGTAESITAKVRSLRSRADLSLDALAQQIGYKGASSVQRYENPNEYAGGYLKRDLVSKLEAALVGKGSPPITRAEVWELAGPEFVPGSIRTMLPAGIEPAPRKGLPIPPGALPYGGAVAAGDWLTVDDFNQDAADTRVPDSVPRHPRFPQLEQIAWRVRGNSMDLAGILDGEWLVGASYADYVDKVGELDNGYFVVVERTRYQGSERELTVKEVQFARLGMRLIPRSSDPRHKEFFVPLDEEADSDRESIRILGVVLWVGRDLAPGAK
jgi:SOS-response transcriptional repressor LexA